MDQHKLPGTNGTLERIAIVTAPAFNETSSADLVPLGKIPTTFPSFNKRDGILSVLGPGFARSTGNAFTFLKNQFLNFPSNNSFFGHVMNLSWIHPCS